MLVAPEKIGGCVVHVAALGIKFLGTCTFGNKLDELNMCKSFVTVNLDIVLKPPLAKLTMFLRGIHGVIHFCSLKT